MAQDHFQAECPNCGGKLELERLSCPECHLKLEGAVELPRLARLSAEERAFVELFVLSAGSLKEVGRVLHLSYPTVRNRLDQVIASLRELDRTRHDRRLEIIRQLERREISVENAAELLAALS